MLHLPLLCRHQLGSVAKTMGINLQRKCFPFLFPGSSRNGLCRHRANVSELPVGLCWPQLAQEGFAGPGTSRLSSTSPGATGTGGFFWHRFVTGWITSVGDSLSYIPSYLSEGLELRIYWCLSLCIKHDVEVCVLSLPSFLSFWEHLAAVTASTAACATAGG